VITKKASSNSPSNASNCGCESKPLVPTTEWTIVISATLGSFFLGAANPIFYELGVEMTHPVSEGSSSGVITLLINVGGLVAYIAAEHLPNEYVNSVCLVSIAVLFIGLCFIREKYNRLDYEAKRQGYQQLQGGLPGQNPT